VTGLFLFVLTLTAVFLGILFLVAQWEKSTKRKRGIELVEAQSDDSNSRPSPSQPPVTRDMEPEQFSVSLEFEPADQEAPFDRYLVRCRGPIPVLRPRPLAMVVSLVDETEKQPKPVMSTVGDFQEPETVAFRHTTECGKILPCMGIGEWTNVGVIIPEILVPPKMGKRQMAVIVRAINSSLAPQITLGFDSGKFDPAIITSARTVFEYDFKQKGYEDSAEDRQRGAALIVRLAVAMAMADGALHESEGMRISSWIRKLLETVPEHR